MTLMTATNGTVSNVSPQLIRPSTKPDSKPDLFQQEHMLFGPTRSKGGGTCPIPYIAVPVMKLGALSRRRAEVLGQ